MIHYVAKEGYTSVKWKKTEIGRIYLHGSTFFYGPRGMQDHTSGEKFTSLRNVKEYLEKGELSCPIFQKTAIQKQ